MNLGRAAMLAGAVIAVLSSTAPTASAETRIARPAPPSGVWLAGDTHVHDDHSSDGSVLRQGISQGMNGNVSVKDQIGQGERSGVNWMPLTDHRTYDQHWDPLWTSNKLVLVPGEEANGSPHATPLGITDELVDGANPPGSLGYRHVQQSIWDIHAQNASWGMAHPDDGEWDGTYPNMNANVLGVDTVEVWNRDGDPEAEMAFSEQRWNHGYRFGVVGGSDDHFKELWAVAGPGQPTTWVFAPETTERGIIAGLKAGRTSVSSGPLAPRVTLTADMNGDGVFEAIGGDEVSAVAGKQAVLKIRVQRGAGTTVRVYAAPGKAKGAKPLAVVHPAKGDKTYLVPIAAKLPWYRVEVRGPGGPSSLRSDYVPTDTLLAVTSPLFVDQGTRATAVQENPMPALSSGDDTATAAIAPPGVFTGWADIDATHVVAEQDISGRARVAYRRLDGEASVLSDTARNARFPTVASAGNQVWVSWQDEGLDQTPHRTNIVERHSGDGGVTWSPIYPVTTDGRSQHPALAMAGARPVFAWQSNAGGAFNIWSRIVGVDAAPVILSAAGKTVKKGNALDTRSAIYPASVFPSIAVARGDGQVAIGWQDNRLDIDAGWTGSMKGEGTAPDDWEIYVATRGLNGAIGDWLPPKNVSRDKFRADRHPSLAYDGNNALFVAWDRKLLHESGVNLELRYAVGSGYLAGITWAASLPLATDLNAMSQHPQLTRRSDNTVHAVWFDSRSADWRWSLWAAPLGSTGAGAVRRLTGNGNATYPAVAGDRVAFTSDRVATRTQRDATHGVFVLTD